MVFKSLQDYYYNLDLEKSKAYKTIIQLVEDNIEDFSFGDNTVLNKKAKSKWHSLIAEHFEPVLFKDCPFFFEIGIKDGWTWAGGKAPIKIRQKEKFMEGPYGKAFTDFDYLRAQIRGDWRMNPALYRVPHPGFDEDHNSIGYTKLFKIGVSGLMDEVKQSKTNFSADSDEYSYLCSMEESLMAVLKIAEKFAKAAKEAIPQCENETQVKYMTMAAQAAENIPKNPPQSFYEGLCMIWFMREVTGSLEGVGISVYGQMDLLLADLYENDIKNGVITKDDARELIRLWLLPTHIKFQCVECPWPESSSCITLGGCDSEGNRVFNDITRMIIEVHHEMKLVAPKLNVRYSKNSTDEYLDLISQKIIAGHNSFALSCDDVVIPGLEKCGYELKDARNYLNGGCQETMVEGVGHTAGTWIYVLLPAILDLSINTSEAASKADSDFAKAALPEVIDDATNFEEFYTRFAENAKNALQKTAEQQLLMGKEQKNLNPCPLFSSLHEGCIENGKDYTEGGAKYNISTVCLCGIATLADSLYAIKAMVYDQKRFTLKEFADILLNNWEGNEELRQECIRLPKYGHGIDDVDTIAKRFIADIDECICKIKNERGGYSITSMFTYYLFKSFSAYIRATADGRKDGDYLSQGIAPSRLQKCNSLTESFETVKTVEYSALSGINVLDVAFAPDVDYKRLTAFIRAAAQCGCSNLQPNCLSYEELKDAKINPDKHRDLIVRVSGLSVYFVNLEESIQDEIICRNFSK